MAAIENHFAGKEFSLNFFKFKADIYLIHCRLGSHATLFAFMLQFEEQTGYAWFMAHHPLGSTRDLEGLYVNGVLC